MVDNAPKSAYELAMERLREQDRKAGVAKRQALTAAQKRKIAELRQKAKAKLAELEILHRDHLAAAAHDPDKTREVEEHYAIDCRRVDAELESGIDQVKRG